VLDVVAAWVLNDLPAGYRLAHVRERAGCALDSECRYSSAALRPGEISADLRSARAAPSPAPPPTGLESVGLGRD